MGVYYKTLDKKCPTCGGFMVRVSIKNPFIDSFEDECPKCSGDDTAEDKLHRQSRQYAKRESNHGYL